MSRIPEHMRNPADIVLKMIRDEHKDLETIARELQISQNTIRHILANHINIGLDRTKPKEAILKVRKVKVSWA